MRTRDPIVGDVIPLFATSANIVAPSLESVPLIWTLTILDNFDQRLMALSVNMMIHVPVAFRE